MRGRKGMGTAKNLREMGGLRKYGKGFVDVGGLA
jgi:hypothetical protein